MKHLIIFLNYCQSRIQNPVYRQFATTSLASRNATLLFISKPLEERELQHEVNELRRKEDVPSDVTFHICCTLDHMEIGRLVVQTLTLIRKNYPHSDQYKYNSYCYCLLPELDKCADTARNAAWKSLVYINNSVRDYLDISLLQTCFLYHDQTQQSIAHFLFNITQYSSIEDSLSIPIHEDCDFPPVFASFNALGISYPDDEVRYYLHQTYLHSLLSLSLVQNNPVDMETCNKLAESILSLVPLDNSKVCLQEAAFINLTPDQEQSWDVPSDYWSQAIELSCQGMNDLPREEWLRQLRNRVEVLFQSRFRDLGVDFFFNIEQKKTSDYCRVLFAILQEGLNRLLLSLPYPPAVLKDIVHSVVNRLQQKVLEINQLHQQSILQANLIQTELDTLTDKWNNLGFLDRLRGKNNTLLSQYKEQLNRLFELRTLIPGCLFADKLLNELIPQVASLSDGTDRLTQCCQDAISYTQRNADTNSPTLLNSLFPIDPIMQASQAISVDHDHMIEQYKKVVALLYSSNSVLDGEDLVQRLRTNLSDDIDFYLHNRIKDGTLPAILDVTIVDRIEQMYRDKGGIEQFIAELKQQTAISLLLKENSGRDAYLLIAPHNDYAGEYVPSRDDSHLQMLHYCIGISLQQLDGFAGKRMFIEPSIF